jgi:hypothetical protein
MIQRQIPKDYLVQYGIFAPAASGFDTQPPIRMPEDTILNR